MREGGGMGERMERMEQWIESIVDRRVPHFVRFLFSSLA